MPPNMAKDIEWHVCVSVETNEIASVVDRDEGYVIMKEIGRGDGEESLVVMAAEADEVTRGPEDGQTGNQHR